MDNQYKMSQERYDELKTELEYMETVRAKEVADLIAEARSFGDLSENSEYDEAKTEQGKLYSKIAEYKDLVENAIIVEHIVEIGKVAMGCKVTVKDLDEDDYEETYEICGSQEADPREFRISNDSPVGRTLMNHIVGDKVEVEAPEGTLHFEIVSIEN